jgi:hypothetical protein
MFQVKSDFFWEGGVAPFLKNVCFLLKHLKQNKKRKVAAGRGKDMTTVWDGRRCNAVSGVAFNHPLITVMI